MQKQLAIKVVVIVVIGLMILIPTNMVRYKVYERQNYLHQAEAAVAQSWTGPQTIMTPVLMIPYRAVVESNQGRVRTTDKLTMVLPETLQTRVDVVNKKVFKGIYEVPVYNSTLTATGHFNRARIQQQFSDIKNQADFSSIGTPYVAVYIADVRGIERAPAFSLNGMALTMNTGSITALSEGLNVEIPNLMNEQSTAQGTFDFELSLVLRGMGSLAFLQMADESTITLHSDWPHPEFIGASLPRERNISAQGFDATWSNTHYASNSVELLESCVRTTQCQSLLSASSGVRFIEPVDIYLQSERSIKYAMLFIGLSFITFFIFEHVKRIRIHPIQYAFVGLAIAVFYLLLISLAEHIAFRWAYSIAVLCCTSLLLFYVRYMLKSLRSALAFSLMIVILYGLLYVIVQAEDFALLMGSLLVFGVLATLMIVTRKIDWYNLAEAAAAPSPDTSS